MAESMLGTEELAQEVPKKLADLQAVLQSGAAVRRLWKFGLTEDERRFFGNDFSAAFGGRGPVGMWMHLFGVSRPHAIVECARRLGILTEDEYPWLLREIGVLHRTIGEAVQDAIDSSDLVLVERDRKVYWRQQPLTIDWFERSALWSFLWEICLSAKHGGFVDHMTFAKGEKSVGASYPAKTRSQLVNIQGFPLDLDDLFKSSGRNSLKLDLPPERIHIFRIRSIEILEEII